jgi:hypothetical protein
VSTCRAVSYRMQGGKVMGDVVGVLADAAGGGGDQSAGADANARRRMSLMSDVTGSATPQTGSERERKNDDTRPTPQHTRARTAVCLCVALRGAAGWLDQLRTP